MSAWPPRPDHGANARPTKAKAHRPETTPHRGVPTVRQQVGNQVPGARLVYPAGTVCSLDKRWERP